LIREIGARELCERLARGETPIVLDVREPDEIRIARFAGAIEIPLGQLTARLHELDQTDEIVVLCHHGIRSARVASFLAQNGFAKVKNLAGGIDSWAAEIDPSVPRY
jgi:rhodanese-related sulfurtransferase